METAAYIYLEGVVQGVGFRPYVHKLAVKYGIKGSVYNTPAGVEIHAESDKKNLGLFYADLIKNTPPLARITDSRIRYDKPLGPSGFYIKRSKKSANTSTFVSPDISVCDDCLREMNSPSNRRYLYPFINCTNCGPRFSIIEKVPYDRPHTTMRSFNMCLDCATEYNDINDRRYHAQPNACPVCGPQVFMYKNGKVTAEKNEAITSAIRYLRNGAIIAVKGIGGFHIACDAHNTDAIKRLRLLKKRPSKPFSIMTASTQTAREWCDISDIEEKLLSGPERPIVLLKKKTKYPQVQDISPDNNYIGIMLCYTPLHYLLFSRELSEGKTLSALIMTSGNAADDPIEIDNDSAMKNLSDICDHFLVHNRTIHNRSDDSIVQVMDGKPVVLRRSRGYSPFPFISKKQLKPTLACGAELKNTFCLANKNAFFVSQYIGDLKSYSAYQFYKEAVARQERMFSVKPAAVARDLHPDYLSSRYAEALKARNGKLKIQIVQHHHAHCAATAAEHSLTSKFIGVCFDGIGLGADGNIWGGEFFHGTAAKLRRAGRLEYIPMPGGDKATKEPFRMAISYLYRAFGENIYRLDIGFINRYQTKLADFITVSKLRPILTSSAGRLFDAVSSILGICDVITYEAQAAVRLQMFAERSRTAKEYRFGVNAEKGLLVIESGPAMEQITRDLRAYVSREEIARKFHNGFASATVEACRLIREKTGTGAVCLSGGVFQNKLLLESVVYKLRKKGFSVYFNELLPANDGAISLGQAAAINAKGR